MLKNLKMIFDMVENNGYLGDLQIKVNCTDFKLNPCRNFDNEKISS